MKLLGLSVLLFLGFSRTLHASCACDGMHPDIRDRLAASAAVLVGTAVYELQSGRRGNSPGRTVTTLVVERAWKGVTADTITVSVEPAGNCANVLTVGRTYLVFAKATREGLVVPIICDGPSPDLNPMWHTSAAAMATASLGAAMIDSLGPPRWQSAAAGSKRIDRRAPARRTADMMLSLAEGYFLRGRMPDIEILGTGQRVTARAEGYAKFHDIAPGFHRARVHLRSGVTEDHYVWVRCTAVRSPCHSARVIWLTTPPSQWGDSIRREATTGASAQMPAPDRRLNAAPRHYVFYGMDRAALHRDSTFLQSTGFEGAQVAYSWRQLEPGKDEYDVALIREDLALLRAHGKKLWIQLQDVSFTNRHIPVPQYLVDDARFGGGVARQYRTDGDDESTAVPEGWAMRRWDPAVQARFHRLLAELGREFDGHVAGINLAETSVTFGTTGRLFPSGFSFTGYRDAVIANLAALRRAFPKSVTLIYGNFMPGEWRPTDDRGYLAAVYRAARELGVGVGGPDLMPHRRGQLRGAYPLIREASAFVPTGLAVQDGNLSEINPRTGARVTASELLEFATSDLHLHYLFWGIEEPFYSAEVVPLVTRLAK